MMHTVLIADDHPLFREALRVALAQLFADGACVIHEAGSVDRARITMREVEDLDIVLLDLKMPGMDGFKGLIELRHEFPAVPVVIVSATEEPAVIRAAIAHGAAGFIPKSLDRGQIAEAMQAVLDGGTWVPDGVLQHAADGQADRQQELAQKVASLTAQQLKVLELVAQGKPNKVIAYELDIAETTVKAHITVVLRKLGVHSRTQAVLLARDVFAAPA